MKLKARLLAGLIITSLLIVPGKVKVFAQGSACVSFPNTAQGDAWNLQLGSGVGSNIYTVYAHSSDDPPSIPLMAVRYSINSSADFLPTQAKVNVFNPSGFFSSGAQKYGTLFTTLYDSQNNRITQIKNIINAPGWNTITIPLRADIATNSIVFSYNIERPQASEANGLYQMTVQVCREIVQVPVPTDTPGPTSVPSSTPTGTLPPTGTPTPTPPPTSTPVNTPTRTPTDDPSDNQSINRDLYPTATPIFGLGGCQIGSVCNVSGPNLPTPGLHSPTPAALYTNAPGSIFGPTVTAAIGIGTGTPGATGTANFGQSTIVAQLTSVATIIAAQGTPMVSINGTNYDPVDVAIGFKNDATQWIGTINLVQQFAQSRFVQILLFALFIAQFLFGVEVALFVFKLLKNILNAVLGLIVKILDAIPFL